MNIRTLEYAPTVTLPGAYVYPIQSPDGGWAAFADGLLITMRTERGIITEYNSEEDAKEAIRTYQQCGFVFDEMRGLMRRRA